MPLFGLCSGIPASGQTVDGCHVSCSVPVQGQCAELRKFDFLSDDKSYLWRIQGPLFGSAFMLSLEQATLIM